jgi:hypothetical protein
MRRPCDRCGKKAEAIEQIYSSHTRSRYCLDFMACQRRVAKRKRSRTANPVPDRTSIAQDRLL